MSVIVKYFILRNGVELNEAFTDKKEAEAYDKMLDAADELETLIRQSGIDINMNDQLIRDIAVVLAKNGPHVTQILKNIKPIGSTTPALEPQEDAIEPDQGQEVESVDKSRRKKQIE